MIKPNLFIVGAARGGTTSLYFYLREHPQVCMSRIKEPNFLSSDRIWNPEDRKNYKEITSLAEYLGLFDCPGKQIKYFGDSSVSYLNCPEAAGNIHRLNRDAKIIIVLRHPVERALSHFKHHKASGLTGEIDFVTALETGLPHETQATWFYRYKTVSLYYEPVKRYLDLFKENVLVILKEEFEEGEDVLKKICAFLELPFPRDIPLPHLNLSADADARVIKHFRKGKSKEHPAKKIVKLLLNYDRWDYKTKVKFRDFWLKIFSPKKPTAPAISLSDATLREFREDILKLQDLIDRDLSTWLERLERYKGNYK